MSSVKLVRPVFFSYHLFGNDFKFLQRSLHTDATLFLYLKVDVYDTPTCFLAEWRLPRAALAWVSFLAQAERGDGKKLGRKQTMMQHRTRSSDLRML